MYRSPGKMMPSLVQLENKSQYIWCSAFVLGVDEQVTREDDSFIGDVGKISHSIFSAVQLCWL